jgi:flagellar protein FlbD
MFRKGFRVILLTRLNGTEFYLNPELIQSVEKTPDTVITLLNEKKLVVRESPELIRERYIEYRQRITQPLWMKQDK